MAGIELEDIEKLLKAKQLIYEVGEHIDCNYCKSHNDLLLKFIDDELAISKFNVLYQNDREALQQLRSMLKHESLMWVLARCCDFIGFLRMIKMRLKNGKGKKQ